MDISELRDTSLNNSSQHHYPLFIYKTLTSELDIDRLDWWHLLLKHPQGVHSCQIPVQHKVATNFVSLSTNLDYWKLYYVLVLLYYGRSLQVALNLVHRIHE